MIIPMDVSKAYIRKPKDLLTARQVVEQYPDSGLSRNALWRWARDGLIKAVKYPSGRVRFRRADVEALLEPQAVDGPAPAPSAGSASAAGEGQGTLL